MSDVIPNVQFLIPLYATVRLDDCNMIKSEDPAGAALGRLETRKEHMRGNTGVASGDPETEKDAQQLAMTRSKNLGSPRDQPRSQPRPRCRVCRSSEYLSPWPPYTAGCTALSMRLALRRHPQCVPLDTQAHFSASATIASRGAQLSARPVNNYKTPLYNQNKNARKEH